MTKMVKGSLFSEYVRMIKKAKNADFSRHLAPEDQKYMQQQILASNWYPLQSYEHLGIAILHEIVKGDLHSIRLWGKASFNELVKVYRHLVKPGDPASSIRTFDRLKAGFFNFDALEIEQPSDTIAQLTLSIAETNAAKEAIAYQMTGMVERLLELSGARNIEYVFEGRQNANDPPSKVTLKWNL